MIPKSAILERKKAPACSSRPSRPLTPRHSSSFPARPSSATARLISATSRKPAASPLAQRLFGVDGVTGVFLGSDFISVTKSEGDEWQHIKPAILGAIMEHYMSGAPAVDSGRAAEEEAAGDIRSERRRHRKDRSRSCSIRACALQSPTTAATSSSTVSRTASCSCTCAAPARAARVRRQRCATASRTCSSTSVPTSRRCGRFRQVRF